MKIKLLVAAAATVVASSAMAQSAFEGFYGQIATGYENNTASNLNGTISNSPAYDGMPTSSNTSNQTFGTAPIIIGLGYNYLVAPKWTIGLGVDYSLLSQTSSTFSSQVQGGDYNGVTANGASIKISNRFNVFVTPGYVIDKDKLVYLKAGYSSVKTQTNGSTSLNYDGGSEAISSSNPSATANGYILGLGYKQIITGGVYGFAEANYMSYGKTSQTSTSPYTTGSGTTSINTNGSLSTYQLLVGVGYKF